jgi:hypothetical protein
VTEWRRGAVVEWTGDDVSPDGPLRGERGVLLTTGSVDLDPATGDPADWVVRFKEETGVYPASQLRLVASESEADSD